MQMLIAYQRDADATRLTKYVPDSNCDGQTICFGQGSNLVLSVEAAGGRKACGADQNAYRQSSLETALLQLAPEHHFAFLLMTSEQCVAPKTRKQPVLRVLGLSPRLGERRRYARSRFGRFAANAMAL